MQCSHHLLPYVIQIFTGISNVLNSCTTAVTQFLYTKPMNTRNSRSEDVVANENKGFT